MVTWAFGHLIQLAMPEAYGVANFRRESLPILPPDFQLIPRQVKAEKGYKSAPGVLKQLKVIKEMFDRCDRIIVATDDGREGELIFRYIFHYLNCRKPFVRLWISSLTDKGLAVYRIVKDKKIADVEMTGMWETALSKIEAGSMDADTFRKSIEVYAAQITAELLSIQLSVAGGETCPCPKCGNGRILFYPKVAKCSNVDCTLTIFRNKCDKQLSDKQIIELVTKRKTGLIMGFKGKNGKAFDASLVLDGQFNVGFSFPEKKAKPKK